jgi:hemoglobin-like flavoprotein
MDTNNYNNLFNRSFQRAISPNTYGFYKLFFQKLNAEDPQIASLFSNTDSDQFVKMLIQSIDSIMSYSATQKANKELQRIAKLHGREQLDLPARFYDIWLDCILETVKELDQQYDKQTETSWRILMKPGLTYLKSFCDQEKIIKN